MNISKVEVFCSEMCVKKTKNPKSNKPRIWILLAGYGKWGLNKHGSKRLKRMQTPQLLLLSFQCIQLTIIVHKRSRNISHGSYHIKEKILGFLFSSTKVQWFMRIDLKLINIIPPPTTSSYHQQKPSASWEALPETEIHMGIHHDFSLTLTSIQKHVCVEYCTNCTTD